MANHNRKKTFEEITLLFWQALISRASQRQTVPYQALTQAIGGIVPPVAAGKYLDLLLVYCREKGLPTISTIVVSAVTGQPSMKSKHIYRLYRERENVYAHNWFAEVPPSLEELARLKHKLGTYTVDEIVEIQ